MATGDVGRLQTLLERRRKAKTHGTKDGVKLIVQLARELSTWEPENAVALLEEALDLDEADASGARRFIAPLYLRLGRHAQVETLVEQYATDVSAAMRCSALLSTVSCWLRGAGADESAAREAFEQAFESNWHLCVLLCAPRSVAELPDDMLLDLRKQHPPSQPHSAPATGGVHEALLLASFDFRDWAGDEDQKPAWPGLEGALPWLSATLLTLPPPEEVIGVRRDSRRLVDRFKKLLEVAFEEASHDEGNGTRFDMLVEERIADCAEDGSRGGDALGGDSDAEGDVRDGGGGDGGGGNNDSEENKAEAGASFADGGKAEGQVKSATAISAANGNPKVAPLKEEPAAAADYATDAITDAAAPAAASSPAPAGATGKRSLAAFQAWKENKRRELQAKLARRAAGEEGESDNNSDGSSEEESEGDDDDDGREEDGEGDIADGVGGDGPGAGGDGVACAAIGGIDAADAKNHADVAAASAEAPGAGVGSTTPEEPTLANTDAGEAAHGDRAQENARQGVQASFVGISLSEGSPAEASRDEVVVDSKPLSASLPEEEPATASDGASSPNAASAPSDAAPAVAAPAVAAPAVAAPAFRVRISLNIEAFSDEGNPLMDRTAAPAPAPPTVQNDAGEFSSKAMRQSGVSAPACAALRSKKQKAMTSSTKSTAEPACQAQGHGSLDVVPLASELGGGALSIQIGAVARAKTAPSATATSSAEPLVPKKWAPHASLAAPVAATFTSKEARPKKARGAETQAETEYHLDRKPKLMTPKRSSSEVKTMPLRKGSVLEDTQLSAACTSGMSGSKPQRPSRPIVVLAKLEHKRPGAVVKASTRAFHRQAFGPSSYKKWWAKWTPSFTA